MNAIRAPSDRVARVPVRHAVEADREAVIGLLILLHAEAPHAPLSMERVGRAVDEMLGDGMVLVVDAPGVGVYATLGLAVDAPWFSERLWLRDIWMVVHPAWRQGDGAYAARALLRAARWMAAKHGLPLHVGLMGPPALYESRLGAKIRLYRRELGEPSGATWNLDGGVTR
jgi:hypothetical protein